MRKMILAALAAATMLSSTPAFTQESSYTAGSLWTASRIKVEDGQFEKYMDYLTSTWRANQDYSKAQGWILDYHILNSVNAREGEPDLILLTRFTDMPTAAESERRSKILNARMKQDDHSAESASGTRGSMRKLAGTILYRELKAR